MRDVAIVSFSQLPSVKAIEAADEPELVQPVTSDAMKQVGLTQDDIGFTCSGSTDYLPGRPFSFVAAGSTASRPGLRFASPTSRWTEAFALYEAWVKIHARGQVDSSAGLRLREERRSGPRRLRCRNAAARPLLYVHAVVASTPISVAALSSAAPCISRGARQDRTRPGGRGGAQPVGTRQSNPHAVI